MEYPNGVPKFITKKWVEAHNQLSNEDDRYKPSKQVTFKTPMLQSDLINYSDAHIVVKGKITVTGANNRDRKNKPLHLKIMTHLPATYQRLITH